MLAASGLTRLDQRVAASAAARRRLALQWGHQCTGNLSALVLRRLRELRGDQGARALITALPITSSHSLCPRLRSISISQRISGADVLSFLTVCRPRSYQLLYAPTAHASGVVPPPLMPAELIQPPLMPAELIPPPLMPAEN